MGIRDDLKNVIAEAKNDLTDGEGYLRHLLDEVERHLGLSAEHLSTSDETVAPPVSEDAGEDEEPATDEEATKTPKRAPGRPRKTES